MDYNVTYRDKDKGLQVIVSYKVSGKWKQKSKQGFEDSRFGKRQAKEWAEYVIEELKGINLNNTDMLNITYKEFFNLYVSDHKTNLSPNTLIGYSYSLDNSKQLHGLRMRDIKKIDIQKLYDSVKLSSESKKTLFARIKCVFASAVNEYEIITKNPCVGIRKEKVSDNKKEKWALSKDELEDLLLKLNNPKKIRIYIASILASKCGMRIGEILGLTWSKIDLLNKSITIDIQWNILEGKNNFGFKKLKSKNSYRVIPVSDEVINILKEYKSNYPIALSGRLINIKNSASYSGLLKKAYKNTGYDISVHELRHTYTTNLIANGIDYKTTALLIGDTVEMVMKVYSHVNSDMLERAKKIINNF